jgi:Domain of unknown function (DUF1840)
MIYKFKSSAAGDVIMLEPHGTQMLKLLGRDPAAKGIFEAADMPGLVATLQAAADAEGAGDPRTDDADGPGQGPGLRQRLWPMIDMLRRSHAAGKPIVWGV